MQFLHHITHQAAPAQQMAPELFDELLEAGLALSAGRILMRFRHGRAHREEVADEQRQRFDLDVLVALQAFDLPLQAIQSLGDGGLALVACVRRQPGRQRRRDDGRLGHAFLGGQFFQALGVLVLNEQVEAVLAHIDPAGIIHEAA